MEKEEILHMFPASCRKLFDRAASAPEKLQEIRLRAKKPVILVKMQQEYFLTEAGQLTREVSGAKVVDAKELEEILQHICNYSVYAYTDEIRQGYLTLPGGHRVGVAGQVVMEGEDRIRTIKNIRYLNIRIAHEVKGAAKTVIPEVYENGRFCNTLILSPPGCGKTLFMFTGFKRGSFFQIPHENLLNHVLCKLRRISIRHGNPVNHVPIARKQFLCILFHSQTTSFLSSHKPIVRIYLSQVRS